MQIRGAFKKFLASIYWN